MKDNLIGEKGFEARLQSLCEELAELKARWKRGQRICFWAAAVVLLLCCSVNKLVSESITMTTYYPAPSGVYKRLIATGPGNTILARDSGMVGIGTGLVSPVATLDVGGTGAIKFPVGDSTNRPVPPVAGSVRYNTALFKIEIYNGTKWKIPIMIDSDFSCTGGNTVADIGGYRVHTFTTSGQFVVNGSGVIDVFLVGGGGGSGGIFYSGGGGGGGIVVADNVSITARTYNVIVGAGGMRGAAGYIAGSPGLDSTFNGLAAGGGGGGGSSNGVQWGGTSGRSGNGSGGGNSGYCYNAGGAGKGTGHAGGVGGGYGGGGGGGAGAVGESGHGQHGGRGGAGAAYAYSGSMVTYAGGGGGGGGEYSNLGGAGGAGGGGNGANGGGNPEDGTANTGGGAGGVSGVAGSEGSGGSGIVIIRYPN